MAVEKMIKADGNLRKTARNILDLKICSIVGIGLDDLPDVPEFADAIDEIEDMLADGIDEAGIKETLSQFTLDEMQAILL